MQPYPLGKTGRISGIVCAVRTFDYIYEEPALTDKLLPHEQNIIRFAKKYSTPIMISFGLPEEKYLNKPDNINSDDPSTAMI